MALIKKRPSSNTDNEKPRFKYRPRTTDEMGARKNQRGGAGEGFIRSDVKIWTSKEGDNTIRILPPTWPKAKHIGYEMFAHYSIGPDNSAFLCLEKMGGGADCPICEERMAADKTGDDDLSYELKPKKRVAMWIIDRATENKGPQLFIMPWTLDRDLGAIALDKKTNAVIPIDDPGEDGFDISFTKEKKKGQSFWEYVGVQVDRKPSPLSDDEDQVTEWLDYIQENPIPDLLITSDYDHIKETFGGEITESKAMKQKRKEANDDEEKKTVVKKKEKIAEEEEAEEAPKRKKKIDTNELTYDEIQNMDEDALTKLIEDKDIDQPEEGFEDLDEAKSFVCEELQLSPPKKKKKVVEEEAEEVEEVEEKEPKKKLNWKDKLAKYKK